MNFRTNAKDYACLRTRYWQKAAQRVDLFFAVVQRATSRPVQCRKGDSVNFPRRFTTEAHCDHNPVPGCDTRLLAIQLRAIGTDPPITSELAAVLRQMSRRALAVCENSRRRRAPSPSGGVPPDGESVP